jgi:hypothetical protein
MKRYSWKQTQPQLPELQTFGLPLFASNGLPLTQATTPRDDHHPLSTELPGSCPECEWNPCCCRTCPLPAPEYDWDWQDPQEPAHWTPDDRPEGV